MAVVWSFSPLDEELGLLSGALSPVLADLVAQSGTLLPFAQAAHWLSRTCGVVLSEAAIRRFTQEAGRAGELLENELAAELERTPPEPVDPGPVRQQVSLDGAMVPVVGGEWKEVRTLAVGTVVATPDGPKAQELTYFSRLCDAERFLHLAGVELFRRGTERARDVCFPADAAEWIDVFRDHHVPGALRILDFNHAKDALVRAAHAAYGAGSEACAEWVGPQLHALRHDKPRVVLKALAALIRATHDPEARQQMAKDYHYLRKRRRQLRYAEFAAAGYPIGSGAVESANKQVVQSRLKGPGMHWAIANVNPMLVLCGAYRSGRWEETWGDVARRLHKRPHRHRPTPMATCPNPPPAPAKPPPQPPSRPPKMVNGRPTDAHAWKRFPAVRPHHAKI